jgi:ribosomal protein S19
MLSNKDLKFLISNKLNFRKLKIPFFLIGKRVLIHNGKDYKYILITREKVGYKFGDFCLTRCRAIHKKKSKKK